MSRAPFMRRCRDEWQRLNPRFVRSDGSLAEVFWDACREGVYGFFAPLRLLWWLFMTAWK